MSRARLDADDAASLLRELAWLRKRGGFTAARLVHAPIVDEVLRGGLAHGPIVPCTDGLLVHNRPSILGLWSHWA